jgi:hypothetical protein
MSSSGRSNSKRKGQTARASCPEKLDRLIETREEYWISGPKKNGEDRHWAGSGKVEIDEDVREEYLRDIRGK